MSPLVVPSLAVPPLVAPPLLRPSRAHAVPALLGLLLSVTLVPPMGCKKVDPGVGQAQAYVAALNPILVDNARLARELASVAADVKQNRTDAAQIAGRLDKALVPAAKQIAEHAAALSTPHAGLKVAHAELVEAWQDRAVTYEDLGEAWKSQDLDGIERALDEIDSWRNHQDRSIEALNAAIVVYGLQPVEAYPPITTTAAAPAAAGR